MDNRTIELIGGALLFAGAALLLLASLLTAVELPVVTYVLIGIGLFGGTYLIGTSHPEPLV